MTDNFYTFLINELELNVFCKTTFVEITIPDWFDIEMVMRDHQNINVEGVNFSCARCWSNENIELGYLCFQNSLEY